MNTFFARVWTEQLDRVPAGDDKRLLGSGRVVGNREVTWFALHPTDICLLTSNIVLEAHSSESFRLHFSEILPGT